MSTVFSRFISVLNIPFIYAQEVKHHFDESENISPYLPYGKEGPKVTENSAVQLINRYCGTLPQDKFSNLNPEIEDDDEIPIVNYTPRKYTRKSPSVVWRHIIKGDLVVSWNYCEKRLET